MKNLKRKVITFEFFSDENVKENIRLNSLREKELEKELQDLKERNKILIETLRKRDKNLKEIFPKSWKDKRIIVIVDSNIFVRYGTKVFEILKKHCILLPRVILNELDNLKDKKVLENNESFYLILVSCFLK